MRPIVVLASWLLLSLAHADESEAFQAFTSHWKNAQQAHSAKQYQEAATQYQKVIDLYPFVPSFHFPQACCYARLGKTDEAFHSLQQAIEYGWCDVDQLQKTDDLLNLHRNARFAKLISEATACRKETVAIYAGKSMDRTKPVTLVVLLQGLGTGPRSELPYWKAAADELGLVLIAPRGVTEVGPMLYGWHRQGARDSKALDYYDLKGAQQRIDEAFQQVKQLYAAPERIILAGFSQGGGVALRLIGDHPERYQGAIAICSLCQSPGMDYWKPLAQQRIRVAVLAGKLDKLLPRSETVVEHLRTAGVPIHSEVWERTGHEYPSDYPECLTKALGFIMKQ